MSETLVIYRLGSLGDTIIALPCLHKIVERFPNHRRIVLTNFPVSNKAAPIEAILDNGGFIHGAIAYPYGTRSPSRLFSVMNKIRSLRADALIYLAGGRGVPVVYRDLAFFRLAGIRRVIGAPLSQDLDAGRVEQGTGEMEREASRLARCLAEIGPIDLDDPKAWDLRLTPDEYGRANGVLGEIAKGRLIAVNTGGKAASKDWGDANWTALLSRLALSLSVPLVFIGAEADRMRADVLAGLWKHPVLNACGQLSPRETAALLRRADLFIGHDSGPLHLAAANGVQCVGIYGSDNAPAKWYPHGSHHHIHHDVVDVRRISPRAVEASVLELWSTATLTRASLFPVL